MIRIKHIGDFTKTKTFFYRILKKDYYKGLERLAQQGVDSLVKATPKDTGKTASHWGYEILIGADSTKIYWTNDNMAGTAPVAVILQYGHATRSGAYVKGTDYINPAIRPIFDKIADEAWREVMS